MQDFAFIDETIDINLTQSYKLSIQACLSGLSFCVLDPVRNKYIALIHQNFDKELEFDNLLDKIEEYLNKNDILNNQFKSVKLIWVSNKNILIPSVLFSDQNLKKYFEFNQSLNDLDEIHFKELKYSETYSVYTIPNQIANIFINKYSNIKFYNQQIPFLNHTLFKYHSETSKVFIHVNDDFFDLAITKNGKLLLYNNFIYKNELDMIYYIMYAFDRFKFNTETTELILSGIISKESSAYIKIKDFIRQIKFDKLPDDFSYSYTFNEIPHHTYTNLFNLNHCE